jgi:hypothetical protein
MTEGASLERSEPLRRPQVRRPWPGWQWLLAGAAVLFTWAFEFIALAATSLKYSSTCNGAPHTPDVAAGQKSMLITMLVVVVPWVGAAILGRRNMAWVVAATLACLPIVLFWLRSFQTDYWVGGFCF